MENERYYKEDGVIIKEGNHSLLVGSKGVIVGLGATEPRKFYDVAGLSTIHPDRVIVNILHVDEIEKY